MKALSKGCSELYLWYGLSFISSMPSHFLLPDVFVQTSPFFLTQNGDKGGSCAEWEEKRPQVAYLRAGFDGGDYRIHTHWQATASTQRDTFLVVMEEM